jgi:hypothetical protein
VFLAVRGQVEVERGGLERLVAEVLLDLAEVDAGFEEMGGGAVAELWRSVWMETFFFSPTWRTTRRSAPWTLFLGIGCAAVVAVFWSRPTAGKSQRGWRWVHQESRSICSVRGGSGT